MMLLGWHTRPGGAESRLFLLMARCERVRKIRYSGGVSHLCYLTKCHPCLLYLWRRATYMIVYLCTDVLAGASGGVLCDVRYVERFDVNAATKPRVA